MDFGILAVSLLFVIFGAVLFRLAWLVGSKVLRISTLTNKIKKLFDRRF